MDENIFYLVFSFLIFLYFLYRIYKNVVYLIKNVYLFHKRTTFIQNIDSVFKIKDMAKKQRDFEILS